MADRRRASAKDLTKINCSVRGDTKAFLTNYAGEYGYGVALDRLVQEFKSLKRRLSTPTDRVNATSTLQ